MKILIVTQAVDQKNPILGFFTSWIIEFSKYFEKVTVVCLTKGEYSFPSNVEVYSLGKEMEVSKFTYLYRFYKYIFSFRKEYDVVFVHMNPIYVVLGGLLWKVLGKKIGLWYVHKNVDSKLRMATFLVDYILTASKESFRLESKKIRIVGHGIDTEKFKPDNHSFGCRIITVGRISKTKSIKRMIEVFALLSPLEKKYDFTIIGDGATLEDLKYKSEVLTMVKEFGLQERVHFVGSMDQDEVAQILPKHDIFLNFSDTGSVDKAVLEAAAAGLQIFTTNPAFRDIFPNNYLDSKKPEAIMEKIISMADYSHKERGIVLDKYDLKSLVSKIKAIYE